MTLCDYGTNTAQKGLNMAAILKFKMAAEDAFEKNGTNSGFVCKGIRMQKNLGSTSIGNFALDYITPCTNSHSQWHVRSRPTKSTGPWDRRSQKKIDPAENFQN